MSPDITGLIITDKSKPPLKFEMEPRNLNCIYLRNLHDLIRLRINIGQVIFNIGEFAKSNDSTKKSI